MFEKDQKYRERVFNVGVGDKMTFSSQKSISFDIYFNG